ncbi:hypothetical protein AMAG_18857 [Allomyces macrogynus ATCC 38327]|uniref:Uncharacterized protein n=1 Tax=Allomyces macrogynus (strain ATCC 38327) TaxID=578462 RepID=A0A0L0SJ01_ALLM3|nr:hypothetical protein AMAG_18857 [Allomyces macrogynus ATCC 38327]|eukprot:KNE62360.1 hypothetical protein AMAG_18857 [Allomyces macrogynus ATCC 38327]
MLGHWQRRGNGWVYRRARQEYSKAPIQSAMVRSHGARFVREQVRPVAKRAAEQQPDAFDPCLGPDARRVGGWRLAFDARFRARLGDCVACRKMRGTRGQTPLVARSKSLRLAGKSKRQCD